MSNKYEKLHMDRVSNIGCIICSRIGWGKSDGEIHHIALGSGKRSDFAVACLCTEHHRGASGLHGRGVKAFCIAYRVPGESEYGLLIWVNEDLARSVNG